MHTKGKKNETCLGPENISTGWASLSAKIAAWHRKKMLEESVEVHERVHRAENGEDQSPQSLRFGSRCVVKLRCEVVVISQKKKILAKMVALRWVPVRQANC